MLSGLPQLEIVATLVPFLLVVVPLVLSPGPDTLLILRHTLASGKGTGMAAVLGVQLGLVIHLLLSLAGISLFVLRFPDLYSMLVLAGALYLAWLGVQSFFQKGIMQLGSASQVSWRVSAISALMTNVLNPKVLVLFFTLLPGFISLDARLSVNTQLLLLVVVLITVNTLWQGALVLFCHQLAGWLLRPEVSHSLGRLCGVALLLFALVMVYEHSW